ncbi:MAG: MCE family protein [Rhizobiaceae bacterium]|nr:MCE family protein [Rhizobiaceae bacterium]
METRANYVIVGLFTVLAVLGAFLFVYWTAAVSDKGELTLLRFRIPGSASGLGRGSAVLFNGVRVGEVQSVYIDRSNPSAAIADAMVDQRTPVTRSTQAVIGLAGLTGQANIEMKGGSLQEPNLFTEAEEQGKVPEVIASPSAVTNLLQTAQEILTRTDKVLVQLEGFATDVRPELQKTAENARKFSDALANNSEGVDKFLSSVSDLAGELSGVSQKLDGTLRAAEQIVKSIDSNKVSEIVTNVDVFTRNLTETGKKFDTVVNKVDNLLGSGDAQGVMVQINDTLKAYRQVADTLNAKLGTITDGLARFSGQGLRDAEALINDARRSVNRIEQAITDLERNPQRILGSGDGEVRRYNGRTRR